MIDNPPVYAKHFCNPGDLVASMASLKSYYQQNKRKVILAQQLDVRSNYYPGATHGTHDDAGNMVCMNRHIFDMIRPLIISQDYIEDMVVYEGQSPILIDIDKIRKEIFVNLPHGAIQSWPMLAYPDLAYDLSKPWIELPDEDLPIIDEVKGKILINFTERYRNAHINYYFLRKFKHRLIFAGTEREYLLFTNTWKIDMPLLKVSNFLELAYAIKHAKYLLANQSMCWGIASAIGSPRILEMCEFAANCIPFHHPKSYGFFHQAGVEYYVDILND